jgi:hypothetical protein
MLLAVTVDVPLPDRLPVRLIVLAASEIDKPVPLTVDESPSETVVAESVNVTLLAELEVTFEAVVLAVTSPVAAPIVKVVELRLAVPVLAMEPVTPIVLDVRVVVPVPVRAPVTSISLTESEMDKILPVAVDESSRETVVAESLSVTLLDDVEVTLEAVVLAVTSPVALPIFSVVESRLAVKELAMEPVTPIVEAVSVAVPLPVSAPVTLIVLAASEMDRVLPEAVDESPSETVVAESVNVTLLADVELTFEAVVLAVTAPVAAPTFKVVELRLAVPVLAMEPVTPIVPVVSVVVPVPVCAPVTLMVLAASEIDRVCPLAIEESPSEAMSAVSSR